MGDILSTAKHADLIYDVGLHRGEDTDFYLRKGFRVVAFDANPELVRLCQERFRTHVESGQLTIVEGAIVDIDKTACTNGKVAFFKNKSGTSWGTTQDSWAERNQAMGTEIERLEVDVVDFAAVLRKHGIPRYLKIDIEGCDLVCLNALRNFSVKPDFVSFESDKVTLRAVREEIRLLQELGYNQFQAVEQFGIPDVQTPPNPPREGGFAPQKFERGSSGLFGNELNPTLWKSSGGVLRLYRFIHIGYRLLGDFGIMYGWQFRGASRLRKVARACLKRMTHAEVPGWYDTHARHISAR